MRKLTQGNREVRVVMVFFRIFHLRTAKSFHSNKDADAAAYLQYNPLDEKQVYRHNFFQASIAYVFGLGVEMPLPSASGAKYASSSCA